MNPLGAGLCVRPAASSSAVSKFQNESLGIGTLSPNRCFFQNLYWSVDLSLTRFSLVLDDTDHDDTLEGKDTLDNETDARGFGSGCRKNNTRISNSQFFYNSSKPSKYQFTWNGINTKMFDDIHCRLWASCQSGFSVPPSVLRSSQQTSFCK